MTVTKNYAGAWVISDLVDGYLVTKTFYLYSKAEAIAKYKKEQA